MADFVGSDLLSVLGFIVAVTLASAASVHFELNRLEDATGLPFKRTRKSLKYSAYSLIIIFAIATLIVIAKPAMQQSSFNEAAFNSIAICTILFNLSVMMDLTRTIFKIPSLRKINNQTDE
ncbi:hypothetical protein [Novosphingobium sp.]|uniref:hypothetical protein n=1 Tax=Novosphingobium sp. TaxID=1874826 RepID=UPI002FDE313F